MFILRFDAHILAFHFAKIFISLSYSDYVQGRLEFNFASFAFLLIRMKLKLA